MLNNKTLAKAITLAFLAYASVSFSANLAPENIIPNSFNVKQGSSVQLVNIQINDDALGKIKTILEVSSENGELVAKPALDVNVKAISKHAIELTGSVKQLNRFFSNKKTAPVFIANPEFSGLAQLNITTNDLGQGSSKFGSLNLPEITGSIGINRAPKGWKLSSHTPDIISGNGNWPGGKYVVLDIDGGASPYGGEMGLFLERPDGSTPAESWKTQVSGLIVGEVYTFRLAWQQATVKREDGVGLTYSGGQLSVLIDGKEYLFSSSGNVSQEGWQYADLSFVATTSTSDIQIGVKSNTSNPDGESIVVDTGTSPLTKTSQANINVTPLTLEALSPEPTPLPPLKTEASPKVEKVITSPVTSSAFASSGKLVSSGGLVPQPTIDIIPSIINVGNVTEVPVAGVCLTGATINISCHNSNNTSSILSPTPSATCSSSNVYSTNVNMAALGDETIICTATQLVGADASAQSTSDTATKSTANMAVANITTLEAPIVGSVYKQNILCTNNGISAAQNASCMISGLPTWASSSCASSSNSSIKPGDSISCQISGVPNSAMPINATITTGAENDDVGSNNLGRLSSSSGTVPAPTLSSLQSKINSKDASSVKVSGQCIQNAIVKLSCASNGALSNQLSTVPNVSCSNDGSFSAMINATGLADGKISCHATQTLGAVTSAASNRNDSVKATANMIVPTNVTLATPIVGTPYSQTISCVNTGTSPANNATCSISDLPSWASSACSPTPPTLVAVGASIVCKITGTPTTAAPISATIKTTSSNNEN